MSDLISRNEALALIESMMETYWDRKQILSIVRNNIEKLPSAEPKKGRWIEKEVFDNPSAVIDEWQSAQCSACGLYHTTPYMYFFDNFNFCPNCGAKMEDNKK